MDDYSNVSFEHYDIGEVFFRNNRRYLFDPIREKLVLETKEEIIRQKFVRFLLDKSEVPKHKIDLEVPLSRFKQGTKGRADIVVYGEMTSGEDTPVLIVECKAPHMPLIDDVWIQVDKYDEIMGAGIVVITNGSETCAGKYNTEVFSYDVLEKVPTYNELLEGIVVPPPPDFDFWHRPEFSELLSEENIRDFREYGWIGEDTESSLYPLIMNFAGLLNDESMKLLPNKFQGIQVIKEGIRYTTFGNVGGGGYSSDYKFFIIEYGSKDSLMISLGIFGTAKTVDDPFWGTRKGTTALIVGTDFGGKDHSSLQLNVDRYTTIKDDIYTMWHDGRLTVGNIGSVKRSEVIEYVKKREPLLVDSDDRIILGSFYKNMEITWEQENTRQFFTKLIKYALLRDEIRATKAERYRIEKTRRKSVIKK